MPSGGGALAPSDDEAMDVDTKTTSAVLAAAAEFAGATTLGISGFMVDSEGRIPLDTVAESGVEEQQHPEHSRVTTPANSTKRVRNDEELRRD